MVWLRIGMSSWIASLVEDLDHRAGSPRAATRCSAHFVVIGLIAQHPARGSCGIGIPEVLQGRERPRRTHGFDIGGIASMAPAPRKSAISRKSSP